VKKKCKLGGSISVFGHLQKLACPSPKGKKGGIINIRVMLVKATARKKPHAGALFPPRLSEEKSLYLRILGMHILTTENKQRGNGGGANMEKDQEVTMELRADRAPGRILLQVGGEKGEEKERSEKERSCRREEKGKGRGGSGV